MQSSAVRRSLRRLHNSKDVLTDTAVTEVVRYAHARDICPAHRKHCRNLRPDPRYTLADQWLGERTIRVQAMLRF